ncbi:pyridoxal phosphate-dependent aminotransferase [Saccharicrinis sp. FJH54]|uniref:pyridoxal phosphate-dependent aminotransferase n=1 Tax=Saccharicrinis sp. FJH54 TaxID=3344665 RepID=UPI0035D40A73
MISPAERISNVKEYYFSVKLKEIAKMRSEGIDILNLGIGNPDMPPSDETIEALHKASSKDGDHGYQSYIGIPELRKAFAEWYKTWYGVLLDPNSEILPLIGSKEGITHISLAFLNPGDEVLVPDPGYPTYSSVSELVGAKIRTYDLKEENGWFPDLDQLEQDGVEKVKIMWINYPNMPTGTPATKELFKSIVAFARRNNILVVNDNPYSFILNEHPMSILEVEGAKDVCIELNSMSKSHNMAGWRIGMAAADANIINYIIRVKSNVDSGMYKPLQLAAAEALKAPRSWYDANNAAYQERKKLTFAIMDRLECSYDMKQTGMFVWAKIPDHIECVADFSDSILMKANVFITPGFIFGENGKRFIRISLCSSEKMLKEALRRINEKM